MDLKEKIIEISVFVYENHVSQCEVSGINEQEYWNLENIYEILLYLILIPLYL